MEIDEVGPTAIDRHLCDRKGPIKEAKGRVYGNVGVINGVAEFWERDATKGRTLSYIDVWVWRDKRWQMVDFHCAEVRPFKPPQ